MLRVKFGYRGSNMIKAISGRFDLVFENEWMNTELTKMIVEGIDQSKVIGDKLIESPFLGLISPRDLSGGAKGVILMAYDDDLNDTYFYGGQFGDNTLPFILLVAKEASHDIKLSVINYMDMPEEFEQGIFIENDNKIVYNKFDFDTCYFNHRNEEIYS